MDLTSEKVNLQTAEIKRAKYYGAWAHYLEKSMEALKKAEEHRRQYELQNDEIEKLKADIAKKSGDWGKGEFNTTPNAHLAPARTSRTY